MTAPKLPPAPTRPETTPLCSGSTNGTIPKVAPSAACTFKLNKTRKIMAKGRIFVTPKIIIIPPVPQVVISRTQKRPAMPYLAAALSDAQPPSARANRFISPNIDAIKPAVDWVKIFSPLSVRNCSYRNKAAALLTKSSMPKQQPYKRTKGIVLRFKTALLKMSHLDSLLPSSLTTLIRSHHFPSGQSSEKFQMKRPITRKKNAGTSRDRRQAKSAVHPMALNNSKTPGMNACTKPPPRLPQPPAMALAVPLI
mmetsp:Transcript_127177/g.220041  ORF Transcript_127177/g.220041 Transcript_127177/m.220041 type:complete len:253 (+) Transcript_127177:1643-2401(+)